MSDLEFPMTLANFKIKFKKLAKKLSQENFEKKNLETETAESGISRT